MKHNNSMIKKMLSAALVGAFAITPVMMEMPAAQAAPPGWTQNRNDRGRQGYETFNGRVTKIDSDRRFDLRVGFKVYNVNLSSRLPRRLSKGDTVRVYGHRSGVNDINNANVEIVGNNSGNHNNRYETFVGTVTNIENSRRFDIKANGKVYNVNAANDVSRRLSRGDEVRVTGQRSGDNDIDYARVEFVRNNSGNQGSRYETFVGTVTNIENSRRFDIRANGKIYNVNAANDVSRRLNRGDEVRVTGQRSGDNDIDYARVEFVRNNSGHQDNRYETFNGTVTNIENSRRFDIRANGKIYNVNASSQISRNLRVGNVVRVYGRRSGDNDIDNANVKVVRNR